METVRPVALVVDDEKANLRILSDLLRDDMEVAVAVSGYQALEKAARLKPDLILLDVVMPGLDGFNTIRALRTNPNTKDIPVIFVTGLDKAEDEEKGLRLGAKDYISKPFSPEVVKARVNTQLQILRQRDELQHISHKLVQADQAKSRFLANMSHEIRTPLTTVIGYADAILAGEFAPHEQRRAVSAISANGKHLLALLNDMLDLAKIEDNRLQVESLSVDLLALLEDVKALFADNAAQKGLSFGISPRFPLPSHILTDPTRLKQILFNLVSNAIKFTEQGFVQVAVGCKSGWLNLEVRDSGIGIAKEQQMTLFDAFTQAEASVTRRFGGTGLGLTVSRELARRLGGDISVDSDVGQGSCFRVSLPLRKSPQNQWLQACPVSLPAPTATAADARSAGKLGGRVLVADDYAEGRELVCRMLRALGADVVAVGNGQALLEKALSTHFDLILTDIHMPGMGGMEALGLLRDAGVDTPVVALTANVMTHDIAAYLQQGFAGHLAKPIVRDAFVRTMQRFLPPSSSGTEPALPDQEMAQLRARFLTSLPQRIQAIQVAWQQQDLAQLREAAHTLKGAASLFQETPLAALAAALEDASDLKGAQPWYEALMAFGASRQTGDSSGD